MKRAMILTMAMVILLGISDKALAQSRWLDWCFTRSSYNYGGYGYGYNRSAGRAAVAIAGAVKVVETISDSRIQGRGMKVIEKEQAFQHSQAQQTTWTAQTRSNQEIRARFLEQENQKLKQQALDFKEELDKMQKEIELLKLELEKLKLRQEQAKIRQEIEKQARKQAEK